VEFVRDVFTWEKGAASSLGRDWKVEFVDVLIIEVVVLGVICCLFVPNYAEKD
jgi:hypothetical protein